LLAQRNERGAEVGAEHARGDAFLAAALGEDEVGGVAMEPDTEARGIER
jgi:hypothetical protein